ncbi:AAA family ATPase [Actinopolyspora saharensis]|uniref:AAA family ATPase n=1 Tax=Actinopolyspora saharensis TaxID=995062 RepID=UPI000B87BBF0|nr:AAA family ATPase [Actinopolyspora saharensis]
MSTTSSITLTARLTNSAAENRRGVLRLHPEVLDALGLSSLDAVRITGSSDTVALAASTRIGESTGAVLVDDIILRNAGATEGSTLLVTPERVHTARSITVSGSRMATASISPETLRLALTGKVLLAGDAVSLLPQDLIGGTTGAAGAVRGRLSASFGSTWTNELVTIAATDPAGAVAVRPGTLVDWQRTTGASAGSEAGPEAASPSPTTSQRRAPDRSAAEPAAAPAEVGGQRILPLSDLVSGRQAAARLDEWLRLSFRQPELLERLGTTARLGVLLSGPSGVGKATMVRSVTAAVEAELVELSGPSVAALEAATAAERVHEAVRRARAAASRSGGCVLLVTDVEELLPAADPPPLSTVALDALRSATAERGVALVLTSASPQEVAPGAREPGLADRELTVGPPDVSTRTELLRVLLGQTPLHRDVDVGRLAERTPGFVAADLEALCGEAAVQAALRHRTEHDVEEPCVEAEDFERALSSVRPISMSTTDTLRTGDLTLDDVGDMTEVKQALNETVLWPLSYPDSFARLGVRPSRGVLLHGPPGCGKTFLVRALAGSGELNAIAVKGAELLDKMVGESERAVRELFARAAEAAPTLVFLDEIDALAPVRGQSSNSGVTDRVVAALLTELDGVEPLRDVVVIGATNRPELVDPALLRPGRLERSIGVPPPDAKARAEILRSASRNTPLASDVDPEVLAESLEGYSAADCSALIREAALAALRESMDATEVSATHVEAARSRVRPSLSAEQLAAFEAYEQGG